MGFWSMAKFSILFFVKREDRVPTASGMAMQVIRFFYSIFIKISILLFTISLTLISIKYEKAILKGEEDHEP